MGANRFYEWRPDDPGRVVQVSTLSANGFYEWRPDGSGCVVQVSTLSAGVPGDSLLVEAAVELIVFWWTQRGVN